MKILAAILLAMSFSTVTHASENDVIDEVNNVTNILHNLQITMINAYTQDAESTKASVCEYLNDLEIEARLLSDAVNANYDEKSRERKVGAETYRLAAKAETFCEDQSNVDPNERVYNLGDVRSLTDRVGALALALKP